MEDTLILDGDLSLNIPLDGESDSVIQIGHEPIFRPIEIIENGHYEPEVGVDGFSSVDVDIHFDGYSLDDIASGTEPSGGIILNAKNIRTSCFWDSLGLTSVTFEGTESIGNNAFYGCTNLTSIYGENVITINAQAFMNCFKLTDIKMPKLKNIGGYCF